MLRFVPLVGVLALGSLLPLAAEAAPPLPHTPAETLSGKKIVFPDVLAGAPAVCVFGFSHESGEPTKTWVMHLYESGIHAWSIAELEAAPGFIRGMIRASMRRETPANLQDHGLILTRDDKAWRAALGLTQDRVPLVVLLDASGQLVWSQSGVFNEKTLDELRQKWNHLTSP